MVFSWVNTLSLVGCVRSSAVKNQFCTNACHMAVASVLSVMHAKD